MTQAKPFSIFLSLKWKAFLLTSTIVALIFQGFLFRSSYLLDKEYDQTRHDLYLRHQAEINILISQTIIHLQQLAQATYGYNIAVAEGGDESVKNIDNLLQYYWQAMHKNSGIEAAALYSAEGEIISVFGSIVYKETFIQNALQQHTSVSEVRCDLHCIINVATPLIVEQNIKAIVVLSVPLDSVLSSFHQISGVDLGVLVDMPQKRSTAMFYVEQWQSDLTVITREKTNLKLIALAAQHYSLDQLLKENKIVEWQRRLFEIRVIRIPTAEESVRSRLLAISDVTDVLSAKENTVNGGILFAILSLVIAEIMLLILLWGPMTRLRNTANLLPMLAESAFSEVRKILLNAGRARMFRDESHIVNETAIALSFQLEELQGQLHQRAEQLETRTQELEKEKDFITGLLDTAHALILVQNEAGDITMINHYGAMLAGYDENELVGRPFIEILARGVELLDIRYQLGELVKGERRELHHETDLLNTSGSLVHMSWYHAFMPDNIADENKILTVALDISERKEIEDHLGWLAAHDPLTGLINRRRFGEELEQTIATCNRYGHTCAILYFDLDQFKDVNDTSGHLVGDQMLRCVARQLKVVARESDTLARLGGDEFALIVHETDEQDAGVTADRLCKSLMEIAVEGDGRYHRVSTSVGVALYPEHGATQEELMANADIAMYQAKDAGRNRWRIFDKNELGKERIRQRVYWNDKVKQAISSDTFTVYFQPILHIKTKKVSHYEALLRVFDDDGALLSPQFFIQSAEQSGLILEMDKKIVEKVIAYQSILSQRSSNVRLSVNLSGVSLRSPDIMKHIESCLKKYGVDPASIIFEITETSAVADIDATASIMQSIKRLGCQFALDDFGVGFSSIYYLKQMPIDYLKIDGSFIRRLPDDPEDQVLVKALVEISKAFGQVTVAEFVENKFIMAELEKLGVDYAQGFYISQPKPFDKLLAELLAQEDNGSMTDGADSSAQL